jgi:hypothetical protein
MKHVACALVCVAACSSEDNLGNHVFGEARWSIALGSSGVDRGTAVIVDQIGNVIVAGSCDGVMDFGSGPVGCYGSFISQRASESGAEQWTTLLPDARVSRLALVGDRVHAIGTRPGPDGVVDQFIAVFGDDGEALELRHLGLAGIVTSAVATFGGDGRVLTTGGVGATADVFLASFDASGAQAWSTVFSGEGRQVGTLIAASPDSSVVVLVEASGPMTVGNWLVDAPAWPTQLLVSLDADGEVKWAQPVTDPVHQIAIAPTDDVIVAGCPRIGVLERDGDERRRVDCKDPYAIVDAVAVSAGGLFVLGGHHIDAANDDGELFFLAFERDGTLASSAVSIAHPEPSDSSVDAIAVEPTGEVVFVVSATHAFDFGNGLLPHAGQHDVIVAKLDSSTGRDGQVVLARTVP